MSLYAALRPLLFLLDAETAHGLTIKALKLAPGGTAAPSPRLAMKLWGLDFPNPLGLAAGFDKNAEVPDAMLGLGFGFVETGTVTPLPQPGNPRPRLFRLVEDGAIINRMGFNNEGLGAAAARLAARRRNGLVGANVGANKDSADRIADYEAGVRAMAPLADYLVINVSSPNTPGLRALQSKDALIELTGRCLAARGAGPPLLLKVAPDLTEADVEDIAAVALDQKLDGLIVSNTTIARPDSLRSGHRGEAGGLSGKPLMAPSTAILKRFAKATGGAIPLVGAGGVASGADAYAKIRAGASLVQLYSALVYGGPGLVKRILAGLEALLERDGFGSAADAVGADLRESL